MKRQNSNSDEGQPSPKKLCLSSSFEFKTCCLQSCQANTEREFREHKVIQVMSKNREFDKKVLEVCAKRNDALANWVKGRIRFTTDLHAADAVYHTTCDSSLELIKICLKSTVKTNLASPGFGKPVISDCEKVFQQMMKNKLH